MRSALLRSTLVLAFALPLACGAWHALPVQPGPEAAPSVNSASAGKAAANSSVDWNRVAVWRPLVAEVEKVPGDLLPQRPPDLSPDTLFCAGFAVASLLVSGCLLVRLGVALVGLSRLRRSGRPAGEADTRRCQEAAARVGVPAPALVVDGELESPILLGFFRPAILLPEGMPVREEIFSHELTHLRRHDLWWHLLARWATILMPLQPGFRLLRKALERADEDVCDDAVLVRGANAAAYAKLLLHVAESQRGPEPELCLPMAAFRSQLERRLHRLMDATRPLARRLSFSVLCLGLGPLLAVGVLAGVVFLDSERSVSAAPSADAAAVVAPPKTDNMSFLGHMTFYTEGTAADREALNRALETVEAWHALLDRRRYRDAAAPDFLNDEPVTPAGWQAFLAVSYSKFGQPQLRTLKGMMRDDEPGAGPKITYVTVNYETQFPGPVRPTKLGEDIQLHRGDDGKWRVARFFTYLPDDPSASTAFAKPPPIRSLEVELVGSPAGSLDEMKNHVIALSGMVVGATCGPAEIHRATKRIFASDEATNVAIKAVPADSGVTISILVQPNPVVQEISFEGISGDEQVKLAPLLSVRKGSIASGYRVFEDANRITSQLAKDGLRLAATGAMTMPDASNKATITFKITPL